MVKRCTVDHITSCCIAILNAFCTTSVARQIRRAIQDGPAKVRPTYIFDGNI